MDSKGKAALFFFFFLAFRFQHWLKSVVNYLNRRIHWLKLLIDMNKHPRCLLASNECITSCHSQQMGWPIQCINNESCPNSATARNKQLVGETPVLLIWLHNVKTTAYLKTQKISLNTREAHFSGDVNAPEKHTMADCLITHWFWQFAVGLMWKKKKNGQHFSAGWSNLDQPTHWGCNYDQPAGMLLDTGWAATWGPQLHACNTNMRRGPLETPTVPETNTSQHTIDG